MTVTAAPVEWWEHAARMFEPPPPPRWATPGDLARFLDPRTVQTPALDVIDAALVQTFTTPDARVIISMPPQEGKSQRASRRFPLWGLTQNPNLRIAIASYEAGVARRWGRAIRDDITTHGADLGLRVRDDLSAQHEWQLAGHDGGVFTAGVGGAMTGRPVDMLIIDDPIKGREEADSPTYRERAWDWWQETAATRLAPGAPVVLILTRWHEDDLAGRILAAEDGHLWRVVSIPAQAEDANDPLGRDVGEYMVSARGRTREQWEAIKTRSTARTWAALYQQRPAPVEGAVWKAPWIELNRARTGDVWQNLARVIVSVDPAAKSKRTSDYTGIVVVGLDTQGHGWVLDDRTLRGTPTEWGMAAWDALLDWNGTEVVVEDNQGGEMVLEVMRTTWAAVKGRRRVTQLAPKVTPVTARQSKRVRAEAVAAYYETGRVHHAADGTDRLSKLEGQMLSWTGDGDSPDRIDALTHGLTALFLPAHSGDAVRAPQRRSASRFR
ncbi:terminase family protein [Cellulomonas sp.]|uniref:phage terminase large subunit family protein n=1 Tax=Cellulomonas sp. TaxID=40001 RepID=UPI001B250FC5|nr:terminase family protein [Cellulomonas sp.]MBO9555586.1 terminase family protein [Cellulomonas sp.]